MTTEIDFSRLEKIGSLKNGGHSSIEEGACVMEAAAYIAGEPWSDHPQCVSPVIGAFLRNWNDSLRTDADRDRLLKPLLLKILNTAGPANIEEQRSYLALDWMIRTFLPEWLRLAKLSDEAAKVEALSPIVDMATATAAAPVVREAASAASKAGDAAGGAAWDAARAAAGDAAWAAAWDAAGDAARAAAWDAARAAAGDAARGAAWDAARAAAGDAARAAAGDAARAAAWDAAGGAAWDAAGGAAGGAAWDAAGGAAWDAARAAAGDAARAALKSTTENLQASAVQLVERMADLHRTKPTP